jgi:hypothetical protein
VVELSVFSDFPVSFFHFSLSTCTIEYGLLDRAASVAMGQKIAALHYTSHEVM